MEYKRYAGVCRDTGYRIRRVWGIGYMWMQRYMWSGVYVRYMEFRVTCEVYMGYVKYRCVGMWGSGVHVFGNMYKEFMWGCMRMCVGIWSVDMYVCGMHGVW